MKTTISAPKGDMDKVNAQAEKLLTEMWGNIEIRLHQEFWPVIRGTMRGLGLSSLFLPVALWGIWGFHEELFPLAINIILTVVFSLSYIVVVHSAFGLVLRAIHTVAHMTLREEELAIKANFDIKESHESTKKSSTK